MYDRGLSSTAALTRSATCCQSGGSASCVPTKSTGWLARSSARCWYQGSVSAVRSPYCWWEKVISGKPPIVPFRWIDSRSPDRAGQLVGER